MYIPAPNAFYAHAATRVDILACVQLSVIVLPVYTTALELQTVTL